MREYPNLGCRAGRETRCAIYTSHDGLWRSAWVRLGSVNSGSATNPNFGGNTTYCLLQSKLCGEHSSPPGRRCKALRAWHCKVHTGTTDTASEHGRWRRFRLRQADRRHQIESPKRPTKKSAQGRLPQPDLTKTRSSAEPLKRSGSSLLDSICILRICDIFRIILVPMSRL
jgi:hypothetical protein